VYGERICRHNHSARPRILRRRSRARRKKISHAYLNQILRHVVEINDDGTEKDDISAGTRFVNRVLEEMAARAGLDNSVADLDPIESAIDGDNNDDETAQVVDGGETRSGDEIEVPPTNGDEAVREGGGMAAHAVVDGSDNNSVGDTNNDNGIVDPLNEFRNDDGSA